MKKYVTKTQVNGQPAVKTEVHYDNGSVVDIITDANTNQEIKVDVVFIACKSEGAIIKSLYAQEYQEYERMFLN